MYIMYILWANSAHSCTLVPSHENTVWCQINVLKYTLYNLLNFTLFWTYTFPCTVHTIAINYELVIVSDPFSIGSAIILGWGDDLNTSQRKRSAKICKYFTCLILRQTCTKEIANLIKYTKIRGKSWKSPIAQIFSMLFTHNVSQYFPCC